jgi:hypothetical protein
MLGALELRRTKIGREWLKINLQPLGNTGVSVLLRGGKGGVAGLLLQP